MFMIDDQKKKLNSSDELSPDVAEYLHAVLAMYDELVARGKDDENG